MPPPLEPKKRGKWLYIAVAGVIIAGVCCVLGIVALVVAFNLQKKAAPVQSPLGTTVPVDLPPATILPGHIGDDPSGSARRLRHNLLQRRLLEQ